MDSYMASNGSCFMVTWTIFKNHLLEVVLTQNRETMALWTLTTVDLFYFIMCEDLHKLKIIKIAFDWGFDDIWLHTTLEGPWPHYMGLEVVLGWPLDTFFLGSHNSMVTALGSCVMWPQPHGFIRSTLQISLECHWHSRRGHLNHWIRRQICLACNQSLAGKAAWTLACDTINRDQWFMGGSEVKWMNK